MSIFHKSPENNNSIVETRSASRVSERATWQENEKQDKRIQRKAKIRGPTLLQGEGVKLNPSQLYYTFSHEGKNMRGVKL